MSTRARNTPTPEGRHRTPGRVTPIAAPRASARWSAALRTTGICAVLLALGVAAAGASPTAAPSLRALQARHPGALAPAARPLEAVVQGAVIVAAADQPLSGTAKAARSQVRADGSSVRVTDVASGAWVEARHDLGARGTAEIVGSFVHHPSVDSDGPALLRRLEAEGAEELVVYRRAPEIAEARWSVSFGEAIHGLRLVGRTLELVDERGTPRLRMAAPWIEDAEGVRHAADVRLEGCAVDTDPRGPWGRAPTAPGNEVCDVVLGWPDLLYPAVLDPAWTTTGSMTTPRWNHSALLLDSGNVLVVGGASSGGIANESAELYNPPTQTFSATGSLTSNRHTRVAAKTGAGDVLVVGTEPASPEPDATVAELYDVSAGTWIPTGPLVTPRSIGFSLTTLANGDVLLAGGNLEDGSATDLAEIYDASTNTFEPTGSLAQTRQRHSGVLLATGEVMIFAGEFNDELNQYATTTEVFQPATDTWSEGPSTNRGWSDYDHAQLTDGRILLIGDCYCSGDIPTDLYDPAIGAWVDGPIAPREELTAPSVVALTDERALITGGFSFGTLDEVLLFDAQSQLSVAAPMVADRNKHSATLLSTGQVLVAGGQSGVDKTAGAELYDPLDDGEDCETGVDCASGFCAGGVCCDTPCDSVCLACTAAEKASGPDGQCGPRPAGLECAAGSCSGTVLQLPSACDDFGSCVGGDSELCAPYVCQSDACLSSCSSISDCEPGYACDETGTCVQAQGADCTTDFDCPGGFTCDDDGTCKANEGTSCSTDTDCLEDVCVENVCCATAGCATPVTCTSDDQCTSGLACRFGECVVPPPANEGDGSNPFGGDGGCSCEVPGRGRSPSGAPTAALLALAAGLSARRLRSRSRRPR